MSVLLRSGWAGREVRYANITIIEGTGASHGS